MILILFFILALSGSVGFITLPGIQSAFAEKNHSDLDNDASNPMFVSHMTANDNAQMIINPTDYQETHWGMNYNISNTITQADLTLSKTANPLTYNLVNQTITYSYVIENTGVDTLTDTFSVTDNKATVTCTQPTDGALSPTETMTCTATYTITQADLDAGSLINLATASGGGGTSNQASATVTASQTRTLLLTKTADPLTYNQVGQAITYSYVIRNTGNVTLVATFSVVDNKATVTCTQPADGALSPNETMNCTATHTITQADLDAGSVINLATASGGGVTSNQATATVTSNPTRTLLLTKTAAPLTYNQVSQAITYSYVIRNTGNVTLAATFSVVDNKATVTCTQPADGALSPTETMTCTATHTITQAELDAGSVINLATASGGGVNSNQATATVTAIQNPVLTLLKTALPMVYDHEGQVINYSFRLTNSGNVTLTNPFTVIDNNTTNETCPPPPTILNPGQFITCTASYTIKRIDMTRGTVTNIASATGKFGATTITSYTSTVTVTASHTLTYNYLPIIQVPYPSGVQILPVSYNYESHATLFIIGEVLNNTNSSLTWVKVVVNLFNAADNFLATANTYMWPVDLSAFEKGCFKISLPIPTNWSYYQFQNLTYDVSNTSSGLSIISHIGSLKPDDSFEIIGQVRNNGNLRSNDVSVSGTLYNIHNEPVGCELSVVESTNLNPGQVSSFKIDYIKYYRLYNDVNSYKLRVAGDLP